MEFVVVRCGELVLHGSTSSVDLKDLEIRTAGGQMTEGMEAARYILRSAALRPQAMPTEATRKRARAGKAAPEGPVIPVGFVFEDRLHVVRGLAHEIFEPRSTTTVDEISDGRQIPEEVEFSGRLRPEQERVVGEFLEHMAKMKSGGGALGMITADPGSGKTLMFIALLLLHIRKSALIVVKGRKIVQQWCRRLMDFGVPAESVGIVMGGKTVVAGRHVVVASVDTIVSRGAEFPRSLWQRFGVVCFDEAHHITAQTFVSTYLRVAHARYVVGLTGTPDRKDGTTSQMRWFVGPGVASMENQTPTEVRIAECTFGRTRPALLPGKCGDFNTAKMISDLGADQARARWISRIVSGLVPARQKTVVLTGRTDARDDLYRLVRREMGGLGPEDDALAPLPGEEEEVPVMQTLPRPDTPYFSCMRRIDELYFRAETEEEKSRPDAELASKLRDRAARLRLRFEITVVRRQIRMIPKGSPELAGLRRRCEERSRRMTEEYPFLRSSRIRVDEAREGPLWDFTALEDLRDRVELAGPTLTMRESEGAEDEEEGLVVGEEPEEDEPEQEEREQEQEGRPTASEDAWIAREMELAGERMRETGLEEILRREQLRIPGFDIVEEVPGATRKRPLCSIMGSGQTELEASRCEQARVIFSTVHLVREAWDCGGLDTVVLAFPTVDIRQVLGRPRRLTPRMIETGAGALVVDILDTLEPFSNYIWGRMRIYKQPKYHARISWRTYENEHDVEGTQKTRESTNTSEPSEKRVMVGGARARR